MNAAETVHIHPDALIGWHALSAEEKDRILAQLRGLASLPPAEWPQGVTRRLSQDGPLYVLPAANGLLVVFRREEDGPLEVRHLVLRETIERYPWDRVNGVRA